MFDNAGMQCTRSDPSSRYPMAWECHRQASCSMRLVWVTFVNTIYYLLKKGNLAKPSGDQADVPCWSPEPNLLQVTCKIIHIIVLGNIKEVNRNFYVFHRKTKCIFKGLEHVEGSGCNQGLSLSPKRQLMEHFDPILTRLNYDYFLSGDVI